MKLLHLHCGHHHHFPSSFRRLYYYGGKATLLPLSIITTLLIHKRQFASSSSSFLSHFVSSSPLLSNKYHHNHHHHSRTTTRRRTPLFLSSFLSSTTILNNKNNNNSAPFKYHRHHTTTTTTTTATTPSLSENNSPHNNDPLPPLPIPPHNLQNETHHALYTIHNACRLLQTLQPPSTSTTNNNDDNTQKITTQTKTDASPVTIGDYAAQALILSYLSHHYPNDLFIAEETSEHVLTNEKLLQELMIVTGLSRDDILRGIDRGGGGGGGGSCRSSNPKKDEQRRRVWTLDPIDGTRGFLRGKDRGGQYCVALALIDQLSGKVVLSLLGCPNLPLQRIDDDHDWTTTTTKENERGCLFLALRGSGCWQIPLSGGDERPLPSWRRVSVTRNDEGEGGRKVGDARFCLGVEKYSDPLMQAHAISRILHGPNPTTTGDIPHVTRYDSQVKYGLIARGDAEVFLRLPEGNYTEWIWDHAAGSLIIEEAGGKVTDVMGRDIDFGLGEAKLSREVKGIVATNGGVFHERVLTAYRKQKEDREREEEGAAAEE